MDTTERERERDGLLMQEQIPGVTILEHLIINLWDLFTNITGILDYIEKRGLQIRRE